MKVSAGSARSLHGRASRGWPRRCAVITEARLDEGTRAVILPLLPKDREALREGYETLSAQSRNRRFLAGVPHLTEAMLDHLVDEVDGVDHVALALVTLDEDNFGTPVGVARMIRYQGCPHDADVAVTVVDAWQGRGVATALLAELVRERPAGVDRIVTTVAADNTASLAMLRRLGETTATPAGIDRLDVVVELAAPEPLLEEKS
jgi:RimJ/RimL family protein N-acetyltransferase